MVKAYTKIDTAAYQAPYEVLEKRNRQILAAIAFGLITSFLFLAVLMFNGLPLNP